MVKRKQLMKRYSTTCPQNEEYAHCVIVRKMEISIPNKVIEELINFLMQDGINYHRMNRSNTVGNDGRDIH